MNKDNVDKIKDKIEILMESDTPQNIFIFIAFVAMIVNLLVFVYLISLLYQ